MSKENDPFWNDSRGDFVRTWLDFPTLMEMPEGIAATNITIDSIIKDFINGGMPVINLAGNLKKIEGNDLCFYWFEDNKSNILMGVEFEKKPQALVVRAIGKMTGKGKPPYASDLYNAVLNDRKNMSGNNSIRFMSDKHLSDEGLNIWKKLLSQGHKISIYDADNPGQSFDEIKSEEDLMKYFKHNDKSYRRWQYILSESGLHFLETKAQFNTRRIRELSGML